MEPRPKFTFEKFISVCIGHLTDQLLHSFT